MAYYGKQAYSEMAIPALLLVLVAVVVGAKMFDICPPIIGDILCTTESTKTLIITDDASMSAAQDFGTEISSRVTRITPAYFKVTHIRDGAVTSNNYDLVILYGDTLALTHDARTEIASYVNGGGSLMIVKGAGLHGLNTDGTLSDYVFRWDVEDLSRVINFQPACPEVTACDSISTITASPSQMNDVVIYPVQYDHPIVERMGLQAPLNIDISKYPDFQGITLVEDLQNKKLFWFEWKDAEGKPHNTGAIIAYSAGPTGGKIVYLAYNPLELNQEELFREIIFWAT